MDVSAPELLFTEDGLLLQDYKLTLEQLRVSMLVQRSELHAPGWDFAWRAIFGQ